MEPRSYELRGGERTLERMMDARRLKDRHGYPIFTGPIMYNQESGSMVNRQWNEWPYYDAAPGNEIRDVLGPAFPEASGLFHGHDERQRRVTLGDQNALDQRNARHAADRIGDHFIAHRERTFRGRIAAGAAMERGIHVHNADNELRRFDLPSEIREIILDKAFGPKASASRQAAHSSRIAAQHELDDRRVPRDVSGPILDQAFGTHYRATEERARHGGRQVVPPA